MIIMNDFYKLSLWYESWVNRKNLILILNKLQIRHVVVHRMKGKDGKTEWLTTQEHKFNSPKELIDAYLSSKKPVNPEVYHIKSSCDFAVWIGNENIVNYATIIVIHCQRRYANEFLKILKTERKL